MKDYNFGRLPETWCINIVEEANNPRLQEFKDIFIKLDNNHPYKFSEIFYGKSCGAYKGHTEVQVFNKEVITLYDFFKIIEQPIEKGLNLTEGNWLYYLRTNDDERNGFKYGNIYKIHSINEDSVNILRSSGFDMSCWRKDILEKFFRNATEQEVSILKAYSAPIWQPTTGQIVYVSEDNQSWYKWRFISEYNGYFICVDPKDDTKACSWKYCKEYKEESKKVVYLVIYDPKSENTKIHGAYADKQKAISEAEKLFKKVKADEDDLINEPRFEWRKRDDEYYTNDYNSICIEEFEVI